MIWKRTSPSELDSENEGFRPSVAAIQETDLTCPYSRLHDPDKETSRVVEIIG